MKNIFSILIITLLLGSCGEDKKQSVEKVLETGTLEQVRLKRGEVVAKQQEIVEQLKQLDEKIALLRNCYLPAHQFPEWVNSLVLKSHHLKSVTVISMQSSDQEEVEKMSRARARAHRC